MIFFYVIVKFFVIVNGVCKFYFEMMEGDVDDVISDDKYGC